MQNNGDILLVHSRIYHKPIWLPLPLTVTGNVTKDPEN
jgi:hypothetical protein